MTFNNDARINGGFVKRRRRATGSLTPLERREKEGTFSKVTPEKASATVRAQGSNRRRRFDVAARTTTSNVKRDELKRERGQAVGRRAANIIRTRLSPKKRQTEDD